MRGTNWIGVKRCRNEQIIEAKTEKFEQNHSKKLRNFYPKSNIFADWIHKTMKN